jgi:hypothetical protein
MISSSNKKSNDGIELEKLDCDRESWLIKNIKLKSGRILLNNDDIIGQ